MGKLSSAHTSQQGVHWIPSMSADNFVLYLGTWALVALTPGPAVMCAMAYATRFGFRQALIGILGIQLGHIVFFACLPCAVPSRCELRASRPGWNAHSVPRWSSSAFASF